MFMILSKRFSPLRTTILGLVVSISYVYPLNQTTLAATFRLFPEVFIDETLSVETPTPEKLIDPDLLAQLLSAEDTLATSEDRFSPDGITEAVSGRSNLSLESIVSSLTQVNLDSTREEGSIPDVPILPQVAAPDIYKEIYDFGTTSAEELSDPVSIGVLPVLEGEPIPTPTFGGGVRTISNGVGGTGSPRVAQPSLPRFGGPVNIMGSPSVQFTQPLSQVALPSARRVQAGGYWGDRQVDVFFASLPKAEVVDIDTFMRTIYRTNPSDMIKKIDETLDLTIDANFNTMPAEVFPANAMPSGEFNRSL